MSMSVVLAGDPEELRLVLNSGSHNLNPAGRYTGRGSRLI